MPVGESMGIAATETESKAIVETSGTDGSPPLHQPAMVPQVVAALSPKPGDIVLDLTLGTAGHALALAEAAGPDGLLIGLDADAQALARAESRLQAECPCRFRLFNLPFSRLAEAVREAGLEAVDCALADLGVGTHQLMDPARGFGFESEARLDMRFDTSRGPSAWDIVNGAEEEELSDIFHRLGEERYSRQIAARICREREEGPIDTPAQLAALVKAVVARRTPRRHTWRLHPATRVMMALRIHVNGELDELDALLAALPQAVRVGGRMAILTYHSLEARRVKQAWRAQQRDGLVEVLKPDPEFPSDDEVRENPKVRSVQLRKARRTGGPTR